MYIKTLLCATVATLMLTACNNQKPAETTSTEEPQTEVTTAEAENTEAQAAAGAMQAETDEYKAFVEAQVDLLLQDTEKFAQLLKDGDLEGAKAMYPIARMYYERSEPIAESFGDLDPAIDARLADLTEEAGGDETKAMEGWTGFHKIERILWIDNTTEGTAPIADHLLANIKELRAKVPTVDVTPELMITGAVDLLNEVSTSKITGEENIFSKTDLYDFEANVQGAEKIYEIFKPQLTAKNPELEKEIGERFKEVDDVLAKYNKPTADREYNYVSYTDLSEDDVKALAEAVNKLGEPLSQMGVILEK